MVRNVRRATIRAPEEAVVSRTEITIRLGQPAPIALLPRRSRRGVTHAIPLQQRNTVVGSPAVVRRVSDVCLAAEVERVLAFLDGDAGLLPRLVGSRYDADVGAGGDVVAVELADTGGLVGDARHARVDEVVAPVVESHNGPVEGPV